MTAPTPEQIQAAQVALAASAGETVNAVWPADEVLDAATWAALVADVRDHAAAAGSLAIRQYRRQRSAAGVTTPFRPRTLATPTADELETVLRGAGDKPAVVAAAEDVVFDHGVRTILDNAQRDPQARGYARIPEAGSCAFCLLLATRGAVYKHDRGGGDGDSFAASNAKFKDRKGSLPTSIKVHDNCRCIPEPAFGRYEMTDRKSVV